MELYKFEYKMHLFCLHAYIYTCTHTVCSAKKTQYGIEINGHIHIMKVKKVLF